MKRICEYLRVGTVVHPSVWWWIERSALVFALFFLLPALPGFATDVTLGGSSVFVGAGNVGVPAEEDTTASTETLPDLGSYYGDKLKILQESIASALEAQQKRKIAAQKNKQGHGGDPKIDGPLYLLHKMAKDLRTNGDNVLTDPHGLMKFFHRLKALEKYNDPAFNSVVGNGHNLEGFSYLFPPHADKPFLVVIPGAGGEPFYASAALLKDKARDFTIVGYTYDSNLPLTQIVERFGSAFATGGFDSRKHLLVPYSMGNYVLLSAIDTSLTNGATDYSNSFVLSLAFPPGGSATLKTLPLGVQSTVVAPFVPQYIGMMTTVSPRNPYHSNLAEKLPIIRDATAGNDIVFIEAMGDAHFDRSSNNKNYAPVRDTTFKNMGQVGENIIFTLPPPAVTGGKVKESAHARIWDASETDEKIDAFLPLLLPRKTGFSTGQHFSFESTAGSHRSVRVRGDLSGALAASASSAVGSEPRLFDVLNALLPAGIEDECQWLREVLEDSMMLEDGAEYDKTVSAIGEYIISDKSACSFDEIEKDARAMLKAEGFVPYGSAFEGDGSPVGGISLREVRGDRIVELFDSSGTVFKTIPVPVQGKKELIDENALIAELYRKAGDFGSNLDRQLQSVEVSEGARVGSPLRITWSSNAVENVKIELLHYRRDKVERLLEESVPNRDVYQWDIPEGLPDDVFRIGISDASDPSVKATSMKFDIESAERRSVWEKVAELFRGTDPAAPQVSEENGGPVIPEHAGVNLVTPALRLTGGTRNEDGTYRESEIVILGSIDRTGTDDVRTGFKSSIRYAALGGSYSELVNFDIPALPEDKGAEVSYAFTVRPGTWRFMLCADSESVVAETDESDNCSEPLPIEVSGTANAPAPLGVPELTLSIPLWTGTSAGGGRLRAGDMSLSVKIRNVGEGISEPVKGLWQYAVATGPFYDWGDVSFPPVEPDSSVESSYSWQGGTGLWRARFCILESSAPEGRLCSGAVAVEIIQ